MSLQLKPDIVGYVLKTNTCMPWLNEDNLLWPNIVGYHHISQFGPHLLNHFSYRRTIAPQHNYIFHVGEFTQTIWNAYALDIPKSAPAQFASGLLLKTNAPASLAETVFLSNPREQQLLLNGARQQEIAQNLYNGLAAWYSR